MPISFTFTRQHRLLTGRQFQTVFDNKELKVVSGPFLLLVKENQQTLPRLGLVIGRRKAKLAVDRAAIKRRAREQFRLRQQDLQGLDMVLLLVGNVRHPDRDKLSRDMIRLFDKLLAKRGQD